jgi:hypothetical protein
MCYLVRTITPLWGRCMLQWWYDKQGERKNPDKNLRQCHFVHYESHMNSPGIELGAPLSDSIAKIICIIWCKDVVTLSNTARPIRQRLDQQRTKSGVSRSCSCTNLHLARTRRLRCYRQQKTQRETNATFSKFLTSFDSSFSFLYGITLSLTGIFPSSLKLMILLTASCKKEISQLHIFI